MSCHKTKYNFIFHSHESEVITMSNIIEIKNITKEFKVLNRREGLKGSLQDLFSRDYKIVRAVDNISMNIQQGEIVGYLGPNGAGKSTTIKMMTGILEPTSGEILVGGNVPYQNRTKNAQEIGVVFGQRSQLWWALPLVESFKILKDIYGVSDADYEAMLTLYKSLVDIEPLLHKPVRQMSLGQRTLSDILAAFLHNPKIVFLDEPTIGLDVSMKAKIRTLIHALNKELTKDLDQSKLFRIYVSALTSLSLDENNVISTTDCRLLRRMVRDARTRGVSPVETILRWPSVRRGEERNIFPFQENADVMFNSSLIFELPLLKYYAEPHLRRIPVTSPAYTESVRMLKFLAHITPLTPEEIVAVPPTSVLREFIGGSSIKY